MRQMLVALLWGAGLAGAQGTVATVGPSLRFSLDRPGSMPTQYQLRVDEATGQGIYRVVPAMTEAAPVSGVEKDTRITVDAPTVKRLFAAVPSVKANRCESHNKNIAQTGTKVLQFTQNGTTSACTFNYSNDDRVNNAATIFMAIGETLQCGDRLAAKLRFDRLGLDLELDRLQEALKEGRAVEVGNISPVLTAIEKDERVMDRARRKAAHLLDGAGIPAPQAEEEPLLRPR